MRLGIRQHLAADESIDLLLKRLQQRQQNAKSKDDVQVIFLVSSLDIHSFALSHSTHAAPHVHVTRHAHATQRTRCTRTRIQTRF